MKRKEKKRKEKKRKENWRKLSPLVPGTACFLLAQLSRVEPWEVQKTSLSKMAMLTGTWIPERKSVLPWPANWKLLRLRVDSPLLRPEELELSSRRIRSSYLASLRSRCARLSRQPSRAAYPPGRRPAKSSARAAPALRGASASPVRPSASRRCGSWRCPGTRRTFSCERASCQWADWVA